MPETSDLEHELLERTSDLLQSFLGPEWSIFTDRPTRSHPDHGVDAVMELRQGNGEPPARLLIEVKRQLSPSQAEQLTYQLERYAPNDQWLVAVPWLSLRTRQILEDRNVNYLDFTGNVSLRTRKPTIVIRTDGADQSPRSDDRPRRGITGLKAARLIRELADFEAPRRANELATATGLSEGYVSRLLDSLSEEALIRRDTKTKVITSVDWQGLLRARAGTYQLLKANKVYPALARVGRSRVLGNLSSNELADGLETPVLATGSTATEGLGVRNTVDGALLLYVPPGPDVVKRVAKDLGVLRIDQAADADVLLIQPTAEAAQSIFKRPRRLASGLRCVGYSQLALDCLAGPGRLPADGEALIEWMVSNEEAWRGESPLLSSTG